MKRLHLIAAVAALSLASMFGLTASASAPAAAAPAHASAPSAAVNPLSAGALTSAVLSRGSAAGLAPQATPPGPCHINWWCIFTGTSYTGTACSGVTNAKVVPCRNLDESFSNWADDCGPSPNSQCTVRLYYHPTTVDNGGAWACVDFAKAIPNLSGYTFNNGVGLPGYRAPVWRDVGGLRVSPDPCSNPIGPGL